MSAQRTWVVGAKVAVSVLCLGVLGVRFAKDPVWRESLVRLETSAFLTALAVLAGGLVLTALRSMVLLRAAGAHVGFRRSTHLVFVGYLFNTLLPTAVGGDVVRIWALRDTARLEVVGGAVFLERVLGSACLLGLAIAGSFALESAQPVRLALVAAGAVYAAGVVALFTVRWPVATPPPNAGRLRRIASRLAGAAQEIRKYGGHKAALGAGIVLSFAWQIVLIAVNAILSRGMGGVCPLASLVVLVPIVQAISMIPVSVGGLGIREMGYAAFFRLSGENAAEGAALGFAWLAVSSVVALAGGVAMLVRPVSGREVNA